MNQRQYQKNGHPISFFFPVQSLRETVGVL